MNGGFMMKGKRVIAVLLSLLLVFGMAAGEASQAQAAGKPGKGAITSLKKNGSTLSVAWKNLGCDGYDMQVSWKKNFKYSFDYTVNVPSYHQDVVINGSADYLYARVRGFNNGSSKTYGAWSATKKIKWNGKGGSSGSKKKKNAKKNKSTKTSGKAPKLSKKSVTLRPGQSATITIKNVKASQIKSLSLKKKPRKDFEGKAAVKKLSKSKFKVTGKGDGGIVDVTVTVKLKKAVKGKKTYKLKLTINCAGENGEVG